MSATVIDPTSAFAPSPLVPGRPHRDSMDFERTHVDLPLNNGKLRRVPGRLTRRGMEDAIRAGQSVMIDGCSVARIQDLPTDAELASATGDAGEIERVRAEKQRQIDVLTKERDELRDAGKKAAEAIGAEAAKGAKGK